MKQEKKLKQEQDAKLKQEANDEAAAPPPPTAEADVPPAPMAEPMPTTFAGRYPPQKAVATVRFRSEQKQWCAIRTMWENEGLDDGMKNNESQRNFFDHMRMHTRTTDEDYDSKASEAWRTWNRDHLVRPRRQ